MNYFFAYFFAGKCVLATPLVMLPFLYFLEISGFSNPESCRSKQARYQLSHPCHSFCSLILCSLWDLGEGGRGAGGGEGAGGGRGIETTQKM